MSEVSVSDFNGSVYVSEQLNRQMLNMVQEFALRCVRECASRYKFDGEEAIRCLGLSMVKVERKSVSGSKKESKAPKIVSVKASFPLPYNGELNDSCCYALRQNNGLYTQCTSSRRNGSDYCKSCLTTMEKTGCEIPEYGTIQGRRAVGIFDYVDPKGRKPTSYTKVMKKYKISEEQAVEEAGKLNIVINPEHFVAPEETKRGRPSSNKEPKEKGVKGRPKKSKNVIQIEGDEEEDLFAALVANANEDAEEEILLKVVKEDKAEKEAKLAAEKAAKEAEKAEKEAKKAAEKAAKEAEKAEKEAKLAAEKAEKEAKKAAEKAEKEAKLAAEKAEKEAKLAAEKAEKEAKLAAEKAEKEAKKAAKEGGKNSSKKAKAAPAKEEEEEEEEEPETVKKIEYEGKKYLMSKKSGVVYDYNKYVKEGDLVIVGVWNKNSNKLDFKASEEDSDEESEDEYDN